MNIYTDGCATVCSRGVNGERQGGREGKRIEGEGRSERWRERKEGGKEECKKKRKKGKGI